MYSFWLLIAFAFCTFLLLNNLLSYLRLEHSTEWIWRIINHINYYYYKWQADIHSLLQWTLSKNWYTWCCRSTPPPICLYSLLLLVFLPGDAISSVPVDSTHTGSTVQTGISHLVMNLLQRCPAFLNLLPSYQKVLLNSHLPRLEILLPHPVKLTVILIPLLCEQKHKQKNQNLGVFVFTQLCCSWSKHTS